MLRGNDAMALSTAEAATTASALRIGSAKPNPKWTNSKAAAWPITAIQRMRTSLRRLTETSVPGVGSVTLISLEALISARAACSPAAFGSSGSGQLPAAVAQRVDIDRRAMAARRPARQFVCALKAALTIELDH